MSWLEYRLLFVKHGELKIFLFLHVSSIALERLFGKHFVLSRCRSSVADSGLALGCNEADLSILRNFSKILYFQQRYLSCKDGYLLFFSRGLEQNNTMGVVLMLLISFPW